MFYLRHSKNDADFTIFNLSLSFCLLLSLFFVYISLQNLCVQETVPIFKLSFFFFFYNLSISIQFNIYIYIKKKKLFLKFVNFTNFYD